MSHYQQGVTGELNHNNDIFLDTNKTNGFTTQNSWFPEPTSNLNIQPQTCSQFNHQTGQAMFYPVIYPGNTQDMIVQQQAYQYWQQKAANCLPSQETPNYVPNNYKARVTLVKSSKGKVNTVLKRKRKRTMFTTEQVQTLESFFRKKPYITREERQLFVQLLDVSDTSVKVWFQNRRLKEKREREEREAEAYYMADCSTELQYTSQNTASVIPVQNEILQKSQTIDANRYRDIENFTSYENTTKIPEIKKMDKEYDFNIEEFLNFKNVKVERDTKQQADSGIDSDCSYEEKCSNYTEESKQVLHVSPVEECEVTLNYNESSNSSKFDDIEAAIEKKTDEFGYVTLDDKAMGELVSILDNVLPENIDLTAETETIEESTDDNDSTVYSGSIYEPISPAFSDVDEEVLKARWEPFAPEESLQRLFHLHFC